jgi:hypothetical protein
MTLSDACKCGLFTARSELFISEKPEAWINRVLFQIGYKPKKLMLLLLVIRREVLLPCYCGLL